MGIGNIERKKLMNIQLSQVFDSEENDENDACKMFVLTVWLLIGCF